MSCTPPLPQQPPYGMGFDWDRWLKFVTWGGCRGPSGCLFVAAVPHFGFSSLWGGRVEILLARAYSFFG
jgi:hypothetical protein